MQQHTSINGAERVWEVDGGAAGQVAGWVARQPALFAEEVAAMATYFPHWLLVGTRAGGPATCPRCVAMAVPMRGALRCLACDRAVETDGLLWLGHLPVLARPEAAFVRRQQQLVAAGFAEVTSGETTFLLVPLTVCYPTEWPNEEPPVRYARRWLETMGLPVSSAGHHLISNGRACIFSWGQWQAMTVAAVLQQRMVNHVTSLFKIVAGQSPHKAFIGRIHDEPWSGAGR